MRLTRVNLIHSHLSKRRQPKDSQFCVFGGFLSGFGRSLWFWYVSCVVISYGLCGVVVSWCAGFVVRWFLSSTVVLRWYGGSKVVRWF